MSSASDSELAEARRRLALLLDHLSQTFLVTADLAEYHAVRPSRHLDEATRAEELERARRARDYAEQARVNAARLRRREPPTDLPRRPPLAR